MDYLIAVHAGGELQTLTLRKGERAELGECNNCTVILNGCGLGTDIVKLRSTGNGIHILTRESNRILSAGDVFNINPKLAVAVLESRCDVQGVLLLNALNEISIGRSEKNSICLREAQVSSSHAVLRKTDNNWFIRDSGSRNGTFINGRRIDNHEVELKDGTRVFIGGFMFTIHGNFLRFENTPGDVIFSPALAALFQPDFDFQRKYPAFYRSPRLRVSGESADVEILAPPAGSSKPVISWLSVLLPPSMMAVVMISIAIFMKNNTMIFYTLPMSLISVLMASRL